MFLHAFEVLKMVNGSVFCLRRGCGSSKHLVESEAIHTPLMSCLSINSYNSLMPSLPWFIINRFKFQKNFFWSVENRLSRSQLMFFWPRLVKSRNYSESHRDFHCT